jgi:hypothetical protein
MGNSLGNNLYCLQELYPPYFPTSIEQLFQNSATALLCHQVLLYNLPWLSPHVANGASASTAKQQQQQQVPVYAPDVGIAASAHLCG